MNNPSLEEIRAKMKAEGIDLNRWNQQDARIVGSEAVKGQVQVLSRLKSLLEKALDEDLKKVAVLREQKARLQHGGGGI